jgi:hypothetical protein
LNLVVHFLYGADITAGSGRFDVQLTHIFADHRRGHATQREFQVAETGEEEVLELLRAKLAVAADVDAVRGDIHRCQRDARHELGVDVLSDNPSFTEQVPRRVLQVIEDRCLANDRLGRLGCRAAALVAREDAGIGGQAVVAASKLGIRAGEEIDLVWPTPVARWPAGGVVTDGLGAAWTHSADGSLIASNATTHGRLITSFGPLNALRCTRAQAAARQ